MNISTFMNIAVQSWIQVSDSIMTWFIHEHECREYRNTIFMADPFNHEYGITIFTTFTFMYELKNRWINILIFTHELFQTWIHEYSFKHEYLRIFSINQAIIRCYSLPSSIFINIQAPIHQHSLLFINIRQYSVIFKLIFASIQAWTKSRLNQLFHIHGFQIHSWIWFSNIAKYHIHRWIWFKDEYNIFDS